MKSLSITLDVKSILIGAVGTILIILTLAFDKAPQGERGKFQAVTGRNGHVILDTQTGEFIYGFGPKWKKAEFKYVK